MVLTKGNIEIVRARFNLSSCAEAITICFHEIKLFFWGEKQRNVETHAPQFFSCKLLPLGKGQLISKANCQAEDSSKKRTNEFVFTSMRRVFVRFLEESSARKKTFQDYLTFSWQEAIFRSKLAISRKMQWAFWAFFK